jgi:hypothetical protein
MTTPEHLSHLITAFEHWRSNRKNRRSPIPNALREQAVGLLEYYLPSKITSALRISGGQLKQWKNNLSFPENTTQFVVLPLSTPLDQTPFNVDIRFAQGDAMSLSGVVDPSILISLIAALKS